MKNNKLELWSDPRIPVQTYAYNHDDITGNFGVPCSFIYYRQCANWGECDGAMLGVARATSESAAGAVSHGVCADCKVVLEAQLNALKAPAMMGR